MNAQRRKQINDLIEQASVLAGKANDLVGEIETLRDEEQDYFDNMPESLQGGEKGDKAQTAIDALDNAVSSMQEVESNLSEVDTYLNEATE